jgi:hypothetical protein
MTKKESLEMIRWAIKNNCLDPEEEVFKCDECGEPCTKETAGLWCDVLSLCCECYEPKNGGWK